MNVIKVIVEISMPFDPIRMIESIIGWVGNCSLINYSNYLLVLED